MLDYKVISLYNKTNQFSVDIYQRTKTEYKVRTKIGFTSYNDDFCYGMYELARTCFFYVVNGYEMVHNTLGFEFAYAVHAGVFTEYEGPFTDQQKEPEPETPPPPPLRRSGYENLPIEEEPAERAEDLLIRTENVILDPEIELPWKLAD